MGSGCGLSTGGHDSFPSEIPPKREEPLIYCLLSKNQGHELTEAAVADQRTFCEYLSGVWSIREMILRPSRNHHKSRLWVKVRIYFLSSTLAKVLGVVETTFPTNPRQTEKQRTLPREPTSNR
jgi:hypothetical protein